MENSSNHVSCGWIMSFSHFHYVKNNRYDEQLRSHMSKLELPLSNVTLLDCVLVKKCQTPLKIVNKIHRGFPSFHYFLCICSVLSLVSPFTCGETSALTFLLIPTRATDLIIVLLKENLYQCTGQVCRWSGCFLAGKQGITKHPPRWRSGLSVNDKSTTSILTFGSWYIPLLPPLALCCPSWYRLWFLNIHPYS